MKGPLFLVRLMKGMACMIDWLIDTHGRFLFGGWGNGSYSIY